MCKFYTMTYMHARMHTHAPHTQSDTHTHKHTHTLSSVLEIICSSDTE